MSNKIGCITLKVRDLQKSLTFYRDFLGLKIDFEMEGFVMFKISNSTFAIEQIEKSENPMRGINLSFELENGVDDIYRKLSQKGIRFKLPPTNMDWGGRMIAMVDPDGYEIGFFEMLGPLCEACGMPMKSDKMRGGGIENNPYCVYCCDDSGELKSRKEVRDGLVKFYLNERGVGLKDAERSVEDLMKWLPAWKD